MNALTELIEDASPAPLVWPKPCRTCNAVHTADDWERLQRKGFVGIWLSAGIKYATELRNCDCGSTLAIEVPFPGAASRRTKPTITTTGATMDNATTVLSTRSSRHLISVGQLKHTPLGKYSQEQLQSAAELVALELQKAIDASDEVTMKRLTIDADEVKAELDRRDLHAA